MSKKDLLIRNIISGKCNLPLEDFDNYFDTVLEEQAELYPEKTNVITLPSKLVTASDCLKKYGDPKLELHMCLWDIPSHLEVGVIPNRVYCNKDMIAPLSKALHNLIQSGHVDELVTWDGLFNIRAVRGGKEDT